MDVAQPQPRPSFMPILAQTREIRRAAGPSAYDCITIVFVREGSASLFGEACRGIVSAGDAVLIGANVLYGAEPEGRVKGTVIYLDADYVADQIFWQYADVLHDRLDAGSIVDALHYERAQILRVGQRQMNELEPWLDELSSLTEAHRAPQRFAQIQALWFSIANVLVPHVKLSEPTDRPNRRPHTHASPPRHRTFKALRPEVIAIREAMHSAIDQRWTLDKLSAMVHLSPRQISRAFSDAFGKTPATYLTMLRVTAMAKILRDTDMSVHEAGRRVGWESRNRAFAAFLGFTGMTPSRYRSLRADATLRPGSRQFCPLE